jgi:hypothetical protein
MTSVGNNGNNHRDLEVRPAVPGLLVPLMTLRALMGWVVGVLGRSVGVGSCGFGGSRWAVGGRAISVIS